MSILRTIKCDICGKTQTEENPNEGWAGWGSLQGVKFDGIDNPNLCPEHLEDIADYANEVKHGMD